MLIIFLNAKNCAKIPLSMLDNAQKGYLNACAKWPRVLGNFAHFWDKKKIEKKELIFFHV